MNWLIKWEDVSDSMTGTDEKMHNSKEVSSFFHYSKKLELNK
jgi:hypothetical protein